MRSFLIAFGQRLPGLRAVADRCGGLLQTSNFSSLSHALRRACSLAFVKGLVARLEATHAPGKDALVAVDGMALTLARTQRHRCKKANNKTVGGGVVWAYMVDAVRGVSPVRILKVVEGAWHDTKAMAAVRLIPQGPVYLMDRGFYAFHLLEKWLGEKVRFIVRVKEKSLVYTRLRTIGKPRWIGDKRLELDAEVSLGGPQAKLHPIVRLLIVVLASGERLVLATDRLGWSAERVLAAYKKRWHIERFHRLLKGAVGLAHLYSFDQSGIMFLLHTALLLALLLFFAQSDAAGETIVVLQRALRALRASLGLGTVWKRNTYTPRRKKKPKPRGGQNR